MFLRVVEMSGGFSKERRAPRVNVYGKMQGNVSAKIEARLVDLSTTGARLEHSHVLHPGIIYVLTLPIGGRQLSLKSRVVWSSVSGSLKSLEGETLLLYHSGIEFVDLSDADRDHIADTIASLGQGDSPEGLSGPSPNQCEGTRGTEAG